MTTAINYNSDQAEPTYKQFRLTITNPVLVEALENHYRETGMSEKELAREAIIDHLEEEELIQLS